MSVYYFQMRKRHFIVDPDLSQGTQEHRGSRLLQRAQLKTYMPESTLWSKRILQGVIRGRAFNKS